MVCFSPARYWIAAWSGPEELGKLPGEVLYYGVKVPLESMRIIVHLTARPFFDTMPEIYRLAVLMAVAELGSSSSDKWPVLPNVKKLHGHPDIFVLNVTSEIMVLLKQDEAGKVEIADIVRKSMLDYLTRQ